MEFINLLLTYKNNEDKLRSENLIVNTSNNLLSIIEIHKKWYDNANLISINIIDNHKKALELVEEFNNTYKKEDKYFEADFGFEL